MTIQSSDSLFYKGMEYFVDGSICALGGIPEARRPKFELRSSSCWNGYFAEWAITDCGWLKLQAIYSHASLIDSENPDNLLFEVYKGHDQDVTATWVTKELIIGFGKIVKTTIYDRVYEGYLIIIVAEGKVLKMEEKDSEWWIDRFGLYEMPDFLKKY